ncbi:hypothetical protein SAMN05421819_0697 [Bryocella elongata]|uniref:Uncharacterized protein n=1 Tax=Bryocella elongata TaxID=863522 RepID=A0A1H5TQ33_9BACT|nr:hypothetical protein [Bryocella elongata]SEF64883.1 hypothetical protein SAMN05421819_0697 [Bryocella elongata]
MNSCTAANGATTCTNFPGSRAMNFNPSLAYWNGTLYIGYEEYDNTHALRMFTSTDNGQTIQENTNITNNNEDTTSTEPSLLVTTQNGNVPPTMYVGFRSNDSGHNFLWKYSTDGVNYTASTNTGIQMTSRPVLVQGVSSFTPYITAFYSSNDSNYYLYQATTTF